MDELGSDGLTYAQRQLARYPASHHGSPLTYYPQRHVINMLNGTYTRVETTLLLSYRQALLNLNRDLGGGFLASDEPSTVYSHFLSRSLVTSSHDNDLNLSRQIIKDCLSVSLTETLDDIDAIHNAHPGFTIGQLSVTGADQRLDQIAVELSRSHKSREFLEQIRNTVQLNHVARNESTCEIGTDGRLAAYVCRDLIMFVETTPNKKITVLNFDQILMLLDTVSCRMMVRSTLAVHCLIEKDNLPPWDLVRRIYKWGDDVIREYGMVGYTLIGEFESIITGIFITFQGTDDINLGEGFIQSIIETSMETEQEHGISHLRTMELINILREIPSLNWLSEIFGLRKHWGNPMVDASESGRAVQEKVGEELPVNGTALIRLLASFNRMIVTEFINQHGSWPEGYFCGIERFPLKDAHENKITRLPETHLEHQHGHWALFRFLPNCVLDSYKNDMTLISDKSVSVYRENLDSTYVHRLCTVPVNRHVPEDRRLVLEYIRKDHLSILDIFKIVMSDAIPVSWLANCASMKGTEMKHKKARIFAVLTYEIRQYFAATEDLIKCHLFRYNPHQTMTMNETELLTKLRQVTRQLDPSGDSRYLSVMHIVDFSKWNLRMRYMNTCLIFKSIDDFLGTPGLIEQSHIIFCNMLNMVQDAFNPPIEGVANTESDTIWRNHTCGWEGQRQKGWTILTSALLSDLARVTGVESTICGQGDNQTLLAQFAVPDCFRNPHEWITQDPTGVRATVDSYYNHLERECNEVGLKIKTAETCRSLNFFNYGKRLYMNGIELSMMLKRISKNVTEPNDSYPSSEAIMKTMEGSAYAAGLYGHPSLLPYIMSRFSATLQLFNCYTRNQLIGGRGLELLRGAGMNNKTSFISYLMKIPASLGGPPQLSLAAYLFRGHPDPLCTDLVMLTLRANNGCQRSRQIILQSLTGDWFSDTRENKESLINSPYSLNLDIPISCRQPIENAIKPALRNQCRNPLIRGMFQASTDAVERILLDALGSLEPLHPLIVNDLYSRSVPGRRKAFITGLANTTSLGRLLLDGISNPMINQVQVLEEEQLESWIRRVEESMMMDSGDWIQIPHHELAQQLRDDSWGIHLVGVTVPHPLEQFILISAPHDRCNIHCSSHRPEHLVLIRHSEDLIDVPGVDSEHITAKRSRTGVPYLGSVVAEGIIQKQILCINPDESWRDIIRINTLRRWIARPGSGLDQLLLLLIRSRTDVDQEIIDLATGIPSRLSFNHRANLMSVIASCGVSTTTNMHSRLYLSSNRMGRYSFGEDNYHMAFGPTFLCYQELICLAGVFNPQEWSHTPRTVYHMHVREDNVPVVYDSSLTYIRPVPNSFSITNMPEVLFASRRELLFDVPDGSINNSIWDNPHTASHQESRYGYSQQLLGDSFIRETVVREMITQTRLVGYERRSFSITIGDIGIVGVRNFIRTVAWNFLLLSPLHVWEQRQRVGFTIRAHSFISTFSNSFWDVFMLPLASERNRCDLIRRYPVIRDPIMTSHCRGLRETLISAVLHEMWEIFEDVCERIKHSESKLPMPIFAPSLTSLNFLVSKCVDLVAYVGARCVGFSIRESVDHSRYLSSGILATAPSSLRISLLIVRDQYHLRLRKEGSARIHLPGIRLYPMQYPWIDRLRSVLKPIGLSIIDSHLDQPEYYQELNRYVQFSIPDSPIMVDCEPCRCARQERQSILHSEYFFLRSGLISKAHQRFLDIVWSLQLNYMGVICLGSSTGSEARAFASLVDCNHVYVSCVHKLSDFSPHLAATFVPAAFATGEYVGKLIEPSSTAVASSDLLDSSSIDTILAHIESYQFTGLTCDANFPASLNLEEISAMIGNINEIVIKRHDLEWIICKVPYRCRHDVEYFCSRLSCCFYQVRVVHSPFSRPRSLIMYIVCSQRRSIPQNLCSQVSIPIPISGDQGLQQLCDYPSTLSVCGLFNASPLERAQRMLVNVCGENSFQLACAKYIAGWEVESNRQNNRRLLIEDLTLIESTLKDHARTVLRVAYLAHTGSRMQRHNILQLDHGRLHVSLNKIFLKVNRSELLRHLLSDRVLSIQRTIHVIRSWLSRTHSYSLTTRNFTLDLDVSSFINVSSRHLFEILGHCYQDNFRDVEPVLDLMLFHRKEPVERAQLCDNLYATLPLIRRGMRSDLSWRWNRRSEILCWLLFKYIIGRGVYVATDLQFILEEFHSDNTLLDIQSSNNMLSTPILIKANDDTELLSKMASLNINAKCGVNCPVKLVPIVLSLLEDFTVIKIPWSGLVPNRVLIIGSKRETPDQVVQVYPDFSQILNVTSNLDSTFSDCHCWDCSVEDDLCSSNSIQHMNLDRLCSLRTIETVRDLRHQL